MKENLLSGRSGKGVPSVILGILAACFFPAIFVCARESVPSAMKVLAAFELRDQYGEVHSISFPRTKFMVLMVADHKGSDQIDGWIAPLKERYAGRVDINGVADMGKVPAFLRGMVESRFKKHRKYPVMLDWSGKVAAGLGCSPNQARICLVRPDGTVMVELSGPADPPGLELLFGSLDRALGTALVK